MLAFALLLPGAADAQQLTLLDLTVNPRAGLPETEFKDSQYFVSAAAFANPAPDSLRAPVNYAEGRLHARYEILSKPSKEVILLNSCLDNGSATITCHHYLEPITDVGIYEYDQPLAGQWQYDTYDFGKKVTRIWLALKDAEETLLQPDDPTFANFYPTRYRVTITLVAKGATYVPPGMVQPPVDAGQPPIIMPPVSDAGAPADAGAAPTTGTASVVIVDQRLTASAASATNAQIVFQLKPETPANLRSPVDYSAGKLHARVEVFSRPGSAPISLTACLESSTSKTLCSAAIGGRPFLSIGAYEHEQTLSSMQNAATYDFASATRRAYLVMKDAAGAAVPATAEFFPTDVRFIVTLIPPGGTYTPPWDQVDKGSPSGGATDAGSPSSAPGPSAERPDGGAAPGNVNVTDAGSGSVATPAADAGASRSPDPFDRGEDDPFGGPDLEGSESGGCALGGSSRGLGHASEERRSHPHDLLWTFALALLGGRFLIRRPRRP